MKHNKIFSSEVVHKGKTLDRILDSDSSSGNEDIIVLQNSSKVFTGSGVTFSLLTAEQLDGIFEKMMNCEKFPTIVLTTSDGPGSFGPQAKHFKSGTTNIFTYITPSGGPLIIQIVFTSFVISSGIASSNTTPLYIFSSVDSVPVSGKYTTEDIKSFINSINNNA